MSLGLRPEAILRGYWEEVTVIEEIAEWLPTERWEEVDDVQGMWDETCDRTDTERAEILELPELAVSNIRAA